MIITKSPIAETPQGSRDYWLLEQEFFIHSKSNWLPGNYHKLLLGIIQISRPFHPEVKVPLE